MPENLQMLEKNTGWGKNVENLHLPLNKGDTVLQI